MDFTKLFQKIRELDERPLEQTQDEVQEGDWGWDDPRYDDRKPEKDPDAWKYDRDMDNEDEGPTKTVFRVWDGDKREYVGDEFENAKDAIEFRKSLPNGGNMSIQQAKIAVKEEDSKIQEIENDIEECGEMAAMPAMPAPQSQQDSVSMNVSMNGSGPGGLRDLMNILRNLEDKPKTDMPPSMPPMVKSLDKAPILGAEDFANSPDEKVAPMSAVIPTGDDLHSKGKEAPKVNGGGNPLSLAARLESLYHEVKSR
jgi:hypothetical protein